MSEERKLVSILFADIVGSTAFGAGHDAELVRGVMRRYFARMHEIATAHGGTVEKYIGDAVMVVFGVPRLHEDDAERAVRSALAMRDAVDDLNRSLAVELALRIGVNSGEVVSGVGEEHQFLITGDPVNVAARLQQGADPGEVVVGSLTERLTRDAIDYQPRDAVVAKGKVEPVTAFRAVRAKLALPGQLRPSPGLVGREREVRRLQEIFARVVEDRRAAVVTVLGPAGVGKSRLVAEVLARIAEQGNVRILRGRCLPYGAGITYWALMDVIRQDAGIAPSDDRLTALARIDARLAELVPGDVATAIGARIATLMGLESASVALPGIPAERMDVELTWGVRRYLEAIAALGPLIVAIDDLQWAESSALELLAQLADGSVEGGFLLLCVARPELLERYPAWSAGRLNASLIGVEPLDATETQTLIARILGTEGPSPLLDPRTRSAPRVTRSTAKSWCSCSSRPAVSRSRAAAGGAPRATRCCPCPSRSRQSSLRVSTACRARRRSRCSARAWSGSDSRWSSSWPWTTTSGRRRRRSSKRGSSNAIARTPAGARCASSTC